MKPPIVIGLMTLTAGLSVVATLALIRVEPTLLPASVVHGSQGLPGPIGPMGPRGERGPAGKRGPRGHIGTNTVTEAPTADPTRSITETLDRWCQVFYSIGPGAGANSDPLAEALYDRCPGAVP